MSMSDFISTILSSPYNPVNIRSRSTRTKAFFALSLVCFFWGTTWLASKQGVKFMPALQMAGIRQFLGGVGIRYLFFVSKGYSMAKGQGMDYHIRIGVVEFYSK